MRTGTCLSFVFGSTVGIARALPALCGCALALGLLAGCSSSIGGGSSRPADPAVVVLPPGAKIVCPDGSAPPCK